MIRKRIPQRILLIGALFLALFFLPTSFSAALRSMTASLFYPIWNFTTAETKTKIATLEQEVKKLQLLNNRLLQDPMRKNAENNILSAKVVFRSHAAWQSSIWIDLGEKKAPFSLINAPVMVGDVILGVIEEVKELRSRVRLITDSHLIPSVRVVRKGKYLAKGELRGAVKPTFRRPGQTLIGTGFNYDFADAEGEAKPLSAELIQPGDHLVTTGFDGVFPKGLKVAKVTKIIPLKEGDYYFDIEAESLIPNLNAIEVVQVLPPL